jgi:hypothetical protein
MVARLHADTIAVLAEPEIQKRRMQGLGSIPVGSTPRSLLDTFGLRWLSGGRSFATQTFASTVETRTMFDLFQFVADCREAMRADKSHKYVQEVVARAVSDSGGRAHDCLANRSAPGFTSCINPTA